MQIRQTGQPIPVSKVETDRREEVKNIKPIGSQKIPDSFETGSSGPSSNQSSSSAAAEPQKKAGQITGRILINQLTQARLAEAGIKASNQSNETKGKKDLSDRERNQAVATDPKVDLVKQDLTIDTSSGARIPDGAFTGDARTNVEKNREAMQNFLNEHNIDLPSSGTGTQSTENGGGIDASDFGVGKGVDLGNGFNTQQGPGDPMGNVNDQFARADYLNGVGNAANRLSSQTQDAMQGMDGADMNFGKDMIKEPSLGVDLTMEEIEAAKKKYAAEHPDGAPAKPGAPEKDPNAIEAPSFKDIVINFFMGQGPKGVVLPPTPPDPETGKSMLDGFKAIFGSKDRTPETETKKGTKNATDQTEENYVNPDELRKMDEMLENLGLDGIWNHQRGPKDQGKGPDYGPEGPGPVGVSAEDAGGSLLSQFGKDGLIGNPNQQNEGGPNGNSNFGGLPGETVTDPIEGETYHGEKRDKEVDVSVQTGIEQNVDDEEEKKRKLKMEFKAPTGLPYNKL